MMDVNLIIKIIISLIVWYTIGLSVSLYCFAKMNKEIFGDWQIEVTDLLLAMVLGLGGLLTVISFVLYSILNRGDDEKVVWRKKD